MTRAITINGVKRVTYASKLVRKPAELADHEQRSRTRAAVAELKRAPCADCRRTLDPVCMDFDHRPGTKKLGSVSSLIWAGLQVVLREIAKCDLVCANCHRLRTHTRRR